MYYECCVCKSSRKDAVLYHFPCTEKRLNKWLKFINRNDLKELTSEQLSKLFVCQKHFEKKFINSTSRLIGIAYPTLFSEEEISSGIPYQDNAGPSDYNKKEHSYARRERRSDHTYAKPQKCQPLRDIPQNIAVNPSGPCNVDLDSDVASPGTYEELPANLDTDVSDNVATTSLDLFDIPGASQEVPYTIKIQYPVVPQNITPDTPSNLNMTGPSEPLPTSQDPVNEPASSHLDLPRSSQKLPWTLKNQRIRLVQTTKDFNSREKMLYQELKKAKHQISFFKKAKKDAARQLSKAKLFDTLTSNMNPIAKKLMDIQMNQCKKNINAYRYSEEDKLFALTIMKKSPDTYKFLEKIFTLPSRTTLKKMFKKISEEPGISPPVGDLMTGEDHIGEALCANNTLMPENSNCDPSKVIVPKKARKSKKTDKARKNKTSASKRCTKPKPRFTEHPPVGDFIMGENHPGEAFSANNTRMPENNNCDNTPKKVRKSRKSDKLEKNKTKSSKRPTKPKVNLDLLNQSSFTSMALDSAAEYMKYVPAASLQSNYISGTLDPATEYVRYVPATLLHSNYHFS